MQGSKPITFTNLLITIAAIYKQDMSDMVIDVYWHALKRFEPKSIEYAFEAHITDISYGQFLPMPTDIVHRLQNLQAWDKEISETESGFTVTLIKPKRKNKKKSKSKASLPELIDYPSEPKSTALNVSE
ncbi:MAG: hypothetical protein V3V61_04890 [Gammaproteobacteria bacterium]